MTYNNMNSLNKGIQKEIENAMKNVSKKVLLTMEKSTSGYYTGSEPKVYKRTYALKKTPKTTPLQTSNNGNTVKFDAYLDQTHRYTTGDKPTMGQVLDLTNYGIAWSSHINAPIGNPFFWEDALNSMQDILDHEIKKVFK